MSGRIEIDRQQKYADFSDLREIDFNDLSNSANAAIIERANNRFQLKIKLPNAFDLKSFAKEAVNQRRMGKSTTTTN